MPLTTDEVIAPGDLNANLTKLTESILIVFQSTLKIIGTLTLNN